MGNRLVVSRDGVIKNLSTLRNYLINKEDKEDSIKIFNRGMWFVVEKIDDDLFFGPSKFVGYEDNTLKMNSENSLSRDGNDTNKKLLDFYDQIEHEKINCTFLMTEFKNFLNKFGLKLSGKFTGFFVPKELSYLLNLDLLSLEYEGEQQTEELDNKALYEQCKLKCKKEERQNVTSIQFYRNPAIPVLIKRKAEGKCDLCNNLGPFILKNNHFLECHHIDWLSRGGEDSIENAVALCPNCHRKMHNVENKNDIDKLKEIAQLRAKKLEDEYK